MTWLTLLQDFAFLNGDVPNEGPHVGHSSPYNYPSTLNLSEHSSTWDDFQSRMNMGQVPVPGSSSDSSLINRRNSFRFLIPNLPPQNDSGCSLTYDHDAGVPIEQQNMLGIYGDRPSTTEPISGTSTIPDVQQDQRLSQYYEEQQPPMIDYSTLEPWSHQMDYQMPVYVNDVPDSTAYYEYPITQPTSVPQQIWSPAQSFSTQPNQLLLPSPIVENTDLRSMIPCDPNLSTGYIWQADVPRRPNFEIDNAIPQPITDDFLVSYETPGPVMSGTGGNRGLVWSFFFVASSPLMMKQVNSEGSCVLTNVATAQSPEQSNKNKIKIRNVSSKISKGNNKQLVIQKQWKKAGTMQTRFAIPNQRPLRRQLDEDEKQNRKAIRKIEACLHCKCRGIKVCKLMHAIAGPAGEKVVHNIGQCDIARPCNSCSTKYHDWSWNPCDFENILGIFIDFGRWGIIP